MFRWGVALSRKSNVYFLRIILLICCTHRVAGGVYLRRNREVGESPAQSRYCNWYAAHCRGVLYPSGHCSCLNGKARCVDIDQEPGDLPDDVTCEVLPHRCSSSFASKEQAGV